MKELNDYLISSAFLVKLYEYWIRDKSIIEEILLPNLTFRLSLSLYCRILEANHYFEDR